MLERGGSEIRVLMIDQNVDGGGRGSVFALLIREGERGESWDHRAAFGQKAQGKEKRGAS